MNQQGSDSWTVVTADRIIIGTEAAPIDRGAVVIQGDEIRAVGRQDEVGAPEGVPVTTITARSGQTVLPGMVDVHTHLVMPGDGTSHETFMRQSDGVLLLQAARNALIHLRSGVTTVTDTGARGMVTFALREAIELGVAEGPRLVVCGRPITRTGGHCWFLGAEADGPDEISATARQLLKEGADIIKVMATGGGTAGTYPYRPSLRVDELTAAVDEAHTNGKRAIAHVSSTEGMRRVLAARFDVLFHAHFYEADGTLAFQDDVARQIADAGALVNPTLWVNGVYPHLLRQKAEEEGLDEQEVTMLAIRERRYGGQMTNVGKLVEHGVKLVAGSDAGWGRYPFGDLVTELEQMVRIGMSADHAVVAATSRAADAVGSGDIVGSLVPGRKADLLVVNGDPTQDISALRDVDTVMLGGRVIAA